MLILLTNDDGIFADGLRALYDALRVSHDCVVAAPDRERSACSHSLTIHSDLHYTAEEIGFAVSGTPADCVKLGVLHLLRNAPDLVISGINNGPNLGSDIMYSGTVNAALEAAYLGVPALAVSLEKHNAPKEYYAQAASFVAENLAAFAALPLPRGTVLNVNYPVRVPYGGFRYTKAGINLYDDSYVASDVGGGVRLKGKPIAHDYNDDDCDVELIRKGFATVTPLRLDRNDYAALRLLREKEQA